MNSQIVKLLFIDSGSLPDRPHKDKLKKSLGAVLATSEEVWFSYKSETSEQERLSTISDYIETCDVIGLIISEDFIHEIQQQSSSLYDLVTRARNRQSDEVHIIPIILSEIYGWQNISLLEDLEPLPKDGKPIRRKGKNQASVCAEIAKELGELIDEITNHKIEYKKILDEYAIQVFLIYQELLEPNELKKKLKSLEHLDLRKKDIAKTKKIIKQEFNRRTEVYKNKFIEAVSQTYPLPENKLNYFIGIQKELNFSELYVRTLESQTIVTYQQEQTVQQQQIQEEQDDRSTSGFVTACLGGLILIGIVFGSPKNKDQNINPASNQVQSLRSDGWIWLGAIRSTNRISVGQNLETDAFISPPSIPSPGEIVTTVQEIRLRDGAGTGNQLVGVVEANERIQIIRVQPLVNQGYAPPFTEVWAEVHRP